MKPKPYLLPYETINKICNFIEEKQLVDNLTPDNLKLIGQQLWNQNYNCFNYVESQEHMYPPYTYTKVDSKMSWLEFINLLKQIEQQYSQHPNYCVSEIKQFMDKHLARAYKRAALLLIPN